MFKGTRTRLMFASTCTRSSDRRTVRVTRDAANTNNVFKVFFHRKKCFDSGVFFYRNAKQPERQRDLSTQVEERMMHLFVLVCECCECVFVRHRGSKWGCESQRTQNICLLRKWNSLMVYTEHQYQSLKGQYTQVLFGRVSAEKPAVKG